MRLQRRLTLASTLVTASVAIAIGSVAVLSSYTTQIKQVQARLNVNVVAVKAAKTDPVSTALLLSNQTDIPLAVAYVDPDNQLTLLKENGVLLTEIPTDKELRDATVSTVILSQDRSLRIRSVQLNDEDFVLFAADTANIDSERNQQFRILFLVICCAVGISIVAVNRLIRRDIRQIEEIATRSTAIASGDLNVRLPDSQGHSEVDELTQSLNSMVHHLTRLIENEKATHRAMQNFLSDASHELRTPLTVIRGYTEILQGISSAQSEQEQRAFERISSEIERMNQLVEDLLLLAELGEQQPFDYEQVNLSRLLDDAVEDLQSLHPKRSIGRMIESGVMIQGSERLLGQLVSNLVSNVNRHTPHDSEVRFSLHSVQDSVVIKIEDAGPGLPPSAYLEQTQHFQRFDKSRSRKTGGSGLGMSIMQAIVEEHKGSIVMSPSVWGGLCTEIKIPLKATSL